MLEELTALNGAMRLVPGSHRWKQRPPNLLEGNSAGRDVGSLDGFQLSSMRPVVFVAISSRQLGLFAGSVILSKRLSHLHGLFQTSLYLDGIMPCGRYWQEPDWMHFNTLCPSLQDGMQVLFATFLKSCRV